jgi:hypothetical protein
VVMEQRRSQVSDEDLVLIRRIQHLARRAERTAHDHSNFVGPPPSQEHLDLLAEIRALTETHLSVTSKSMMPRQAEPAGDTRMAAQAVHTL